jgi:hypothetical protein
MMRRLTSLHSMALVLLTAFLLLAGAAVAFAQGGPNLLVNGSFETVDGPSLDGWQIGAPELISIDSPGAPGGGDWALQLEVDWAPPSAFVFQKIEGLRDGDIVDLRAEVKAVGEGGGGMLFLVTGNSPWGTPAKSASSLSETWTTLGVADTLELAEGDSVWVRLSAVPGEVVPPGALGLFDSVSLTARSPVPVAPASWGSLKARYR